MINKTVFSSSNDWKFWRIFGSELQERTQVSGSCEFKTFSKAHWKPAIVKFWAFQKIFGCLLWWYLWRFCVVFKREKPDLRLSLFAHAKNKSGTNEHCFLESNEFLKLHHGEHFALVAEMVPVFVTAIPATDSTSNLKAFSFWRETFRRHFWVKVAAMFSTLHLHSC